MPEGILSLVVFLVFATSAAGAPIVVGGFTFADGERAFADNAILISGTVGHSCTAGPVTPATSLAVALSGSDIQQCANTSDSTGGIVEVVFIDNSILNIPGPDLVIFELSGPQAPGTPDPRESFGLSVFTGVSYSAFVDFDPIATGINSVTDPTLDVFSVQVDLTTFGIDAGSSTDRVRLHIRNNDLGTRSADIAALGALNSESPIPEPATGITVCIGLAALTFGRSWRRVR